MALEVVEPTNQEFIDHAQEKLSLPPSTLIDLKLDESMQVEINGFSKTIVIDWMTSDELIINKNGQITRTNVDQAATLTATLTLGSENSTKVLKL